MNKSVIFGTLSIIGLFLFGILVFASMTTIQTGYRGVLLDWGAIQPGVLSPGLHFKNPFSESIQTLNVQVQNVPTNQSAASKDLQVVTTQVAVGFNLTPSKVDQVYTNVGGLQAVYDKIISPAVANAVKAVTAKYNADELIANRDLVRSQIADQIKQAVSGYGVTIDNVNITNFKFGPKYQHAIENKQAAQQRALQSKYELQRAQIDAQKQVVNAEAQAEAQIASAKGDAQATILKARAKAKAMNMLKSQLSPLLVSYYKAMRWNGVVPKYSGSAVPFFNVK